MGSLEAAAAAAAATGDGARLPSGAADALTERLDAVAESDKSTVVRAQALALRSGLNHQPAPMVVDG